MSVVDGGTSYRIEMSYDSDVVNAIKNIPSRKAVKESNGWIWYVAYANAIELKQACDVARRQGFIVQEPVRLNEAFKLDTLAASCTNVTDIEKAPQEIAKHSRFKTSLLPKDYQIVGTSFIIEVKNVLLLDPTGLGKTKQVIDAAKYKMDNGEIKKAIIVCPSTLKHKWREEIIKNCGDSEARHIVIIPNKCPKPKRNRYEEMALNVDGIRWVIYNYEQIWRTPYFVLLCDGQALISDEAHKLRSANTKQGLTFREACKKSSMRVLLTASPIINKPEDIYILSNYVRPGALGHSIQRFKTLFTEQKNNGFGNVTVGYKNGAGKEIGNILSRFSIRRDKSILKLPPKIYDSISDEMELDQAEVYVKLVNDLRATLSEIDNAEGNTKIVEVETQKAITLIIRLQQVSTGYLSDGSNEIFFKSGGIKFKMLDEVVDNICENQNEKLVIWGKFVKPLYFARKRYEKFNPIIIDGSVGSNRYDLINKFRQDKEHQILLCQIQTAGVGIDLYEASNEVFLDRWWNNAINEQAEDRLHRIGQIKSVNVVSLISLPNEEMQKKLSPRKRNFRTTDMILSEILDSKRKIEREVMKNLESTQEIAMSNMHGLTLQDMKKMAGVL